MSLTRDNIKKRLLHSGYPRTPIGYFLASSEAIGRIVATTPDDGWIILFADENAKWLSILDWKRIDWDVFELFHTVDSALDSFLSRAHAEQPDEQRNTEPRQSVEEALLDCLEGYGREEVEVGAVLLEMKKQGYASAAVDRVAHDLKDRGLVAFVDTSSEDNRPRYWRATTYLDDLDSSEESRE